MEGRKGEGREGWVEGPGGREECRGGLGDWEGRRYSRGEGRGGKGRRCGWEGGREEDINGREMWRGRGRRCCRRWEDTEIIGANKWYNGYGGAKLSLDKGRCVCQVGSSIGGFFFSMRLPLAKRRIFNRSVKSIRSMDLFMCMFCAHLTIIAKQ